MNGSGSQYQDLLNLTIVNADTLNLSALDPLSVPYIDASQNLQDYVLSSGQILIGVSGSAVIPNTITGSSNLIVSNGPGSISLDTVQPIAVGSSPTFQNITLSNLTPSSLIASDASDRLQSLTPTTTTDMQITVFGNDLIIDTPQNINTNQTPIFESMLLINNTANSFLQFQTHLGNGNVAYTDGTGLRMSDDTVAGGGYVNCHKAITTNNNTLDDGTGLLTAVNIIDSSLSASSLVSTDASNQLQSVAISNSNTNGSSNTLAYSGTTLSLTSSMAQNLSSSGSPTFADLTLSSLTAFAPLYMSSSKVISTIPAALTNGQIMIGSTGAIPRGSTLNAGTNISIVNGPNNIDISSSLTPSFNSLTVTGLSGLLSAATGLLQNTTITNSNGCALSFAASTLTASMTQDLTTSGSPEFYRLFVGDTNFGLDNGVTAANSVTLSFDSTDYMSYDRSSNILEWFIGGAFQASLSSSVFITKSIALAAPSNQLIFGGSNQYTLTASPTANRTYTFPDAGANANFLMSEGAATVNGVQTFSSGIVVATIVSAGDLRINTPTSSTIYIGHDINTTNVVIGAAVTNTNFLVQNYNATISANQTDFSVVNTVVKTLNNILDDGTGLASFSSIKLATTGGTASSLAYYEEYLHTTSWGGAFAPSSVAGNVKFTRVGRVVTAVFPIVTGPCTTTNALWMLTNAPTRFCPSTDMYIVAGLAETTTGVFAANGTVYVAAAGNFQYSAGLSAFNSSGSPTVGIGAAFGISYSL